MTQQPDKFFLEKLEKFQKPVSASAWNRVQANLDNKKKSLPLVFKIAASLLIFLSAAIAIWTINRNGERDLIVSNPAEIKNNTRPKQEDMVVQAPIAKEKYQHDQSVAPIIEKKKTKVLPVAKKPDVDKQKPPVVKDAILTGNPLTTLEPVNSSFVTVIEEKTDDQDQGVTIIYSAEELKSKYLNKKSLTEATPEDKKPSTLRKLVDKAYDLKTNQDPVGELRQKKNEILALNFKNDKQRTQNR
jgi:hypothetical protein